VSPTHSRSRRKSNAVFSAVAGGVRRIVVLEELLSNQEIHVLRVITPGIYNPGVVIALREAVVLAVPVKGEVRRVNRTGRR